MVREVTKKKIKVKILSHDDIRDGDLEDYINKRIEDLQNSFASKTVTDFDIKNVNIEGKIGDKYKLVTILYSYIEHTILDDF